MPVRYVRPPRRARAARDAPLPAPAPAPPRPLAPVALVAVAVLLLACFKFAPVGSAMGPLRHAGVRDAPAPGADDAAGLFREAPVAAAGAASPSSASHLLRGAPAVAPGAASPEASASPSPSPSTSPSAPPPPPPPAAGDDPRTALCIVGHLRTFLLPPVYESIHAQLVASSPGRTDVYVFLTTGHGARGDSRAEPECSAAPLDAALALLRPLHVSLFGGASRCEEVRFGAAPCCGGAGAPLRALAYMQLSWIDACFATAAAAGRNYTHFMRTRPDLFIGAPPPRWAWAPAHAHTVFTMDKDAPGSDMFFLFARPLLDLWWRRVPLTCDAMPNRYAEYFIFGFGDEERTRFMKPWAYDRARCAAEPCAAGAAGPAADAEPPPDGGALPPALVQLPAMRNIVVRSASRVDCHQAGFYCPPGDAAALLARLGAFACSDVVAEAPAPAVDAPPVVVEVPWEGGREVG
jgi:hypothetical protein